MRQDQDFDKTIRIPTVTDVVRAGDPAVVEQVKNPQGRQKRREVFERHLKERIEELQAATRQDGYSGLARAHAIRSENNHQTKSSSEHSQIDPSVEKHIDQAREELVRELSGMLKR